MGSHEANLVWGTFSEGDPEILVQKSAISGEEMLSDIRVNVLIENGGRDDTGVVDGGLQKVVGSNLKQLRLRRAISDLRFKAKLIPVHPDEKIAFFGMANPSAILTYDGDCMCDFTPR